LNAHREIYNTTRWKKLRRYHLSCQPLCVVCGKPATDVDHIKPISQGGEPWAVGNLQSLCHGCHSVKTNADMAGRPWSAGTGSDGYPVAGNHHWGEPGDDTGGTFEKKISQR
jgi:5-methylcytosine-specific restriction enzyme A